MRIGVDLDGVTFDFVRSLRMEVVATTGRYRASLPTPTQWNFWHDWGMSKQEWRAHFNNGVKRGTLFGLGTRLDHGLIDQLFLSHSIHIVTHRPEGAARTTETWLARHGVRYDTLTFTEDKTLVPVDVAIDDKPDNVRALLAEGTAAVLYDRPWNQEATDLPRVGSWSEFAQHVKVVGG